MSPPPTSDLSFPGTQAFSGPAGSSVQRYSILGLPRLFWWDSALGSELDTQKPSWHQCISAEITGHQACENQSLMSKG